MSHEAGCGSLCFQSRLRARLREFGSAGAGRINERLDSRRALAAAPAAAARSGNEKPRLAAQVNPSRAEPSRADDRLLPAPLRLRRGRETPARLAGCAIRAAPPAGQLFARNNRWRVCARYIFLNKSRLRARQTADNKARSH